MVDGALGVGVAEVDDPASSVVSVVTAGRVDRSSSERQSG